MLSLAALQSRMTDAVLSGDFSGIAGEFTAARGTPQRRLGIFRNNTILSLTAALAATFPVTVALVDRRFFDYAAASFIAARPPREARLAVYGSEFPRFLKQFPALAKYPFVADVARLEWAIAEVLNGEERAVASELDAEKIALQPCLRFAVSRYDIAAIWRKFQVGKLGDVDPLQRKSARIAVWRQGDKVQIAELTSPAFAFWRALAKGRPLDRAAAAAFTRDRLFDLTRELVTLVGARLIAHNPKPESTS